MRVLSGRRSAVLVAALSAILVLTATGTVAFAAKARSTVFKKSWKATGQHQLTIVVVGTKGHAMVAIDDFVVTK